MSHKKFSAITPEVEELAKLCTENDKIPPELFIENKVNPDDNNVNNYDELINSINMLIKHE